MKTTLISLDAADWSSPDDFYAAILPRLGACERHGRNLDALADGLGTELMTLKPPFTVEIVGTSLLDPGLQDHLLGAVRVFEDVRRDFGDAISLTLR